MSALAAALEQIRIARIYTRDLLSHVPESDWFRQPAEGVTHIAWQVGHLAVSQYGLGLRRVRGERPEDAGLISPEYRQLFGKGSTPAPGAARYPAPDEIRAVFDRVHERVLQEAGTLSEDAAQESAGEPPHPLFSTKLGALQWASHHEFIHAGQIALLRRLLGGAPLR